MIPAVVTQGDTSSGISKSQKRYARIPWEVLIDPRLNARDIRVYGMLAASAFQGTSPQVGTRRIAGIAKASLRDVGKSLKSLEQFGHIVKSAEKRGRRSVYTLTSPVFGQKQRAGVEEVISSPSRNRRFASVKIA